MDSLNSMSCQNPAFPQGATRPTFIHAAQHYHACSGGDTPTANPDSCPKAAEGSELWNFHKGHVPSTILECNQPLLVLPPDNLFNVQKTTHDRRNAFMICFLHRMVNDAALDYKRKYCTGSAGYNKEKCVRQTKELDFLGIMLSTEGSCSASTDRGI